MSATPMTAQTAIRTRAMLAIHESLTALKAIKDGTKLCMENISPEARTSLHTWAQGKQDQTLSWWA
jgi:hypothetical protein